METIDQETGEITNRQPQKHFGEALTLETKVNEIFATLGAVYGHKFSSQYPGDKALEFAKKVWMRSLKDCTPLELAKGVNYCLEQSQDAFPPTLTEFRGWCKIGSEKQKVLPNQRNESYEEYYHRTCRQYPGAEKYILSIEMAAAMTEEIKEARKNGETSVLPIMKEAQEMLRKFREGFGKIK
jgi:hypothetical protein